MKRDEDSLMFPPLEELLTKIPRKYELVLTATKRAKQIIRQHRLNPLGIDPSERTRKPLSIALTDIVQGKVDEDTLNMPDTFFDEETEDELALFDEPEAFGLPEGLDVQPEEPEPDNSDLEDTELPEEADLDIGDDSFEVDDEEEV
jgi:DNA-directed RNA polymerase omega subunit